MASRPRTQGTKARTKGPSSASAGKSAKVPKESKEARQAAKPGRTEPPGRTHRAAPSQEEGQAGLVPYLAVEDAARAIDWYKEAFGAREVSRQAGPGSKVMHAELRFGGAPLYLSDVLPGADTEHPTSLGGTTTSLHLQTPQVDRTWARAVSAGAVVTLPLANQFWGERYGKLRDPFGHVWSLSWPVRMTQAEKTRLQDEAMRRFAAVGEPGPT